MVFALTAAWISLSGWDYDLASGLLGEGGSRLLSTVLLGVLAVLSGASLLLQRRPGGDEEYWTGWELVYALALFASLFYGVYSFFGWFFYV